MGLPFVRAATDLYSLDSLLEFCGARINLSTRQGVTMRAIVFLFAFLLAGQPLQAQLEDIRFGNLHAHTSYSDGSGTPEDAYRMACSAGLDFFAITEHNHEAGDGKGDRRDGVVIATSPELYSGSPDSLVASADRENNPGNCVTIYGQEFSTISRGNHVNVFDVGNVIDVENGRFDLLLDWLGSNPDGAGQMPLIQFNHPRSGKRSVRDYGRDDFDDGSELAWQQAMSPHVSLIEVFNAPALKPGTGQRTHDRSSQYKKYLNLGLHLGPSVGQDNHYRNWGSSTDARVAVVAPEFTRRGILAGLRARHVYATEDRNLKIVFRSGSALMGDVTDPPAIGQELPLTIQIVDADEPDASYVIDVYKDVAGGPPPSRPIESFELTGNRPDPFPLEGVRLEALGEYVFLRITQFSDELQEDEEHPDDDVAWTAPIWFEPDHFHGEVENAPSIRMTALLPDPDGDDLAGERITFRNNGDTMVSLEGWQVRDLAGNIWTLDVLRQLGAGQSKSLLRNGASMALNNSGDRVELVAPDGTVVQVFSYDGAERGVEIEVPPDD